MKSLKKKEKRKINHVVFLLDASGSMSGRVSGVRKNMAKLFDDLAGQERKSGIETRVHVHSFGYDIRWEISNVSAKEASNYTYDSRGEGTALIDSTIKLLNNLSIYESTADDVSFLVYVITDGAETERRDGAARLKSKLDGLSDDYTMAILVPDNDCRRHAVAYGFPDDNIQVWDVTSEAGMAVGTSAVLGATQSYYTMRSTSATKSTKTLFKLPEATKAEVKRKLDEIDPGTYETLLVRPYDHDRAIKDFVENWTKKPYRLGSAYFQLTKPEKVQAGKVLAVVEKATGKMFSGPEARTLLGLPNCEVKVAPADFKAFDVFVQSHSTNRKLVRETHLIVFK